MGVCVCVCVCFVLFCFVVCLFVFLTFNSCHKKMLLGSLNISLIYGLILKETQPTSTRDLTSTTLPLKGKKGKRTGMFVYFCFLFLFLLLLLLLLLFIIIIIFIIFFYFLLSIISGDLFYYHCCTTTPWSHTYQKA